MERERGVVTSSRHGVAGFEDLGRGARPSQLIASVGQVEGGSGGRPSGQRQRRQGGVTTALLTAHAVAASHRRGGWRAGLLSGGTSQRTFIPVSSQVRRHGLVLCTASLFSEALAQGLGGQRLEGRRCRRVAAWQRIHVPDVEWRYHPRCRRGSALLPIAGLVARTGAGETRTAQQRDEADEGRFGEGARVVTWGRHGSAGFEDLGRGARPSQLIASVRRTQAYSGAVQGR